MKDHSISKQWVEISLELVMMGKSVKENVLREIYKCKEYKYTLKSLSSIIK